MQALRCSGGCLLLLLAATWPAAAQGTAQAPAVQTPAPTPAPAAGDPDAGAPRAEEPRRPKRQPRGPQRARREPPAPADRSGMQTRVSRVGGPATQTLSFSASLLGGYDDNLAGGLGTGIDGGANPATMASGTVGTLDAGLAYGRGNARHALRLDSRGTAFAYPDYLERPVAGANVSAGLRTTVGRRTGVDLSQTLGYEPFFSAFSPDMGALAPSPAIEQAIPVTGLFERRSVVGRSAVSIDTPWNARHSTTAGYSYGLRRFNDEASRDTSSPWGDTSSHTATAGYRVVVSDTLRLRADYQYMNLEFSDVNGGVLPNRTHRMEGGVDGDFAATRRRRVTWSITAGASRLETATLAEGAVVQTWLPVGTASLMFPLSGTWAVQSSYRRDFSLLQGVTHDVFANDTATLAVTGALTRRTVLQLGTSFANWRTPLPTGDLTALRVYGTSASLRQMLTDTVGVTASYNYYRHRFASGGDLPEGFPSEYDRNAVRVGITVLVPLIGPRVAQAPASNK